MTRWEQHAEWSVGAPFKVSPLRRTPPLSKCTKRSLSDRLLLQFVVRSPDNELRPLLDWLTPRLRGVTPVASPWKSFCDCPEAWTKIDHLYEVSDVPDTEQQLAEVAVARVIASDMNN